MRAKLLQDAVTLFVVVNPIGLVPLFLGITGDAPPGRRRAIARRAVIISAVILLAFMVIGQIMLDALKISLPAFRMGGGLVLLLVALKMVLGDQESRVGSTASAGRDVAVFPIAMPFIAGPGAIMASVLLTDNDLFTIFQQAATGVVMLIVLAITYAVLLGADQIQRLIGATGTNVLGRIFGLVLTALAMETILQGFRAFFSDR